MGFQVVIGMRGVASKFEKERGMLSILSDIERSLPRIASDILVSLRVKNIPVPRDR